MAKKPKTYDTFHMGRSSIDLYSNDIGAPFVDIKSFAAYVGGSPTNISVGVERLGLKPVLLTALGEDPVGDFILYLQKTNAMFFGPMLAVLLLGFFTKRVSALAAKIGLVAGPVLFLFLVFVFGDLIQGWLKETFGLADEVHFLHFLALVFVLTALIVLIISKFKPAKETYVQEYTHDVDITPWKHAKLIAFVISFAAVLFCVFMAQSRG